MCELARRGRGVHEAGAFLLGTACSGRRCVSQAIFYDDLDPDAYASGVCILKGDSFGKLWTICREQHLDLVADVHTHPGVALQSQADRRNPMVATRGHIAIIVPNYGRWPVAAGQLGIYEYQGGHQWVDRSPRVRSGFFHTGFWS